MPAGYEFVRVLGQGGNGWVALARQIRLDRLVAIKTINAGVQDDGARARLQREGQAIASLRHPNVVSVYELLISGSSVSLVMEHVPGGDLRTALDEARLSGSQAISVLCDVAAALEHGASRGIVHRDVKPANVLLDGDGRAKLADFGLARLPRSTQSFRTVAGGAAGTPMYMAPEQIEDPDLEVASIDAYAFAIVAYEVLTGARPYAANDIGAVIYAHLHGTPISPWEHAPGLPGPVGEILLRGLAKRPADRPTPAQLADRLRAISPAEWDAFYLSPRTVRPESPLVAAGASIGWGQSPISRMPAISRVPARRRLHSRTVARLVGAVLGLIIGVGIALVILHG